MKEARKIALVFALAVFVLVLAVGAVALGDGETGDQFSLPWAGKRLVQDGDAGIVAADATIYKVTYRDYEGRITNFPTNQLCAEGVPYKVWDASAYIQPTAPVFFGWKVESDSCSCVNRDDANLVYKWSSSGFDIFNSFLMHGHDVTLVAVWGPASLLAKYTVKVTANEGGTVKPGLGLYVFEAGAPTGVTFILEPKEGYEIDNAVLRGLADNAVHPYPTNLGGGYPDEPCVHWEVVDSKRAQIPLGPLPCDYELNAVFRKTKYTITATTEQNVHVNYVNGAATGSVVLGATETIPVEYGDKVTFTLQPNPGWMITAVTVDDKAVDFGTGNDGVYTYTVNVTGNHILHVASKPKDYTITVHVDPANNVGGTVTPGTVTVPYGSYETFAIKPAVGYEISEVLWIANGSVEANATDHVLVHGTCDVNVNKDYTLKVTFKPKEYTVYYNANGGLPLTNDSLPGVKWTDDNLLSGVKEGEPFIDGWKFVDWNTEPNGTGKKVLPSTQYHEVAIDDVTPFKTLFAQWKQVFKVTYHANGGSGAVPVDANVYEEGQEVTVLGPGGLSLDGYKFIGWAYDDLPATPVSLSPGDLWTMSDFDPTFYAVWVPVKSVIYDGNRHTGGTVPVDNGLHEESEQVTVKGGIPQRDGHKFLGWAWIDDWPGDPIPPILPEIFQAGDTFEMRPDTVYLYAAWEPIPVYTIIYHANHATGGTVPEDKGGDVPPKPSKDYYEGSTVTVLGNPGNLVRANFTFKGWGFYEDARVGNVRFPENSTFTIDAALLAEAAEKADPPVPAIADELVLYAVWVENAKYTVTYNGNGNTGGTAPIDGLGNAPTLTPPTNEYYVNSTVTAMDEGTLVKTGYNFMGWATASDGSVKYEENDTFVITSNTVLYAVWEIKKFEIEVSAGVGGSVTPGTGMFAYDSQPTFTFTPDKGYEIDTVLVDGVTTWFPTAKEDGYIKFAPLKNGHLVDVTFKAKLYTVSFDLNGKGLTVDDADIYFGPQEKEWSEKLALGTTPARLGYTFAGWLSPNGKIWKVESNPAINMVVDTDADTSIVLVAQWTPKKNTVSYYTYGLTKVPDPILYDTDAQVVTLKNTEVTAPGYEFEYWYINTEDCPGCSHLVDTTIITDISGNQFIKAGNAFTMPPHNVKLEAQWNPKSGYEVKFDLAGGTLAGQSPYGPWKDMKWTDDIPLGVEPEKTGYGFAGWLSSITQEILEVPHTYKYNDLVKYETDKSVTLIAQWKENAFYTVKYDAKGGTPAPSDKKNVAWTQTNLLPPPPNPALGGYVFGGWFYEKAVMLPTGPSNDDIVVTNETKYSDLVDGDDAKLEAKLHAIWGKVYSVTYKSMHGATGKPLGETKEYIFDASVDLLPEPTLAGYGFMGWQIEGDSSSPNYKAGTSDGVLKMPARDIILWAQWYPVLTYDTNAGSWPAGTTTPPGGPYAPSQYLTVTPIKPTRPGYTFLGWQLDQELYPGDNNYYGTPGYTSFYMQEVPVTLYAQWRENTTYKVSFKENNGTWAGAAPSPITVGWSTVIIPPSTPTRAGYVFNGWNTKADGTGVPATVTSKYSDLAEGKEIPEVILYAQWLSTINTLTYDPANGTGLMSSTTVTGGSTVTVPVDVPTRAGYTFSGWLNSNDLRIYQPGATFTMPYVNVTMTGQWTGLPQTIAYRRGTQGTFPEVVTTAPLGSATPAAPQLVTGTPGWTFAGWLPAWSAIVTGNVEYVAQWTQDRYTVTYAPGRQGTFPSQITSNLLYGAPTPAFSGTVSGNPGYTFAGWYPSPTSTVTQSVVYEAQWNPLSYTLTVHHYRMGTTTRVAASQQFPVRVGTWYSVPALSVRGYTALTSAASGFMPSYNLEVAIYYRQSSTGGSGGTGNTGDQQIVIPPIFIEPPQTPADFGLITIIDSDVPLSGMASRNVGECIE